MRMERDMAIGKNITLVESCGIKVIINMGCLMAYGNAITLMVGYVLKALTRETGQWVFGMMIINKKINIEVKNQRDKNGEKHGLWEGYHPDGSLWYIEHYKNGIRHGLWEEYYSNGKLCYKGNYKHGKSHGLSEWYYPDGRLRYKGKHKRGNPVGLFYNSYS